MKKVVSIDLSRSEVIKLVVKELDENFFEQKLPTLIKSLQAAPTVPLTIEFSSSVLNRGFFEMLRELQKNHPNLVLEFSSVKLVGDFSKVDFSGMKFFVPDLTQAILDNANFAYANLYGADLRGVNLTGTNFSYCNMSKVDLDQSTLTDVNMTGVNLSKSRFIGTVVSNVNLTDAYMSVVSLKSAHFSNVNLTNANLSRAVEVPSAIFENCGDISINLGMTSLPYSISYPEWTHGGPITWRRR